MNRSSRRLTVVTVALLIAGSVLGGLLGSRVRADQQPIDELWTFGRILALVEDEYVGESDSKELVEDAVDGMLRALDPHSNYLSADSFSEMRDEQRGRFHGLGIQITKRGPDKPLTIISPIDDTPADRAGLLSGDVISEIEGQPTIDLTVQQAVRLLKGDKGTKVTITIERPGSESPFPVTIERDEIPIQSLRVSYMVEPGVGVVRIANFNNTTATELDEALATLTEQGMDRLILDLRGNPGGLLDQAVQVGERFLPEGKLIVYTRGRIPGSNQDFVAKSRDPWVDLPLVVLVDGASASSEIVSGAIQDHDRGLVVGETTFGKGLVQRVIPLRGGGALAVTTAKYYTPTGRLIQRDYTDLDDYYLGGEEIEPGGDEIEDEEDAAPPQPRATEPVEGREVFFTPTGRKVYGGGGITPDYTVKSERSPDLLFELRRDNLIFGYSVAYVSKHPDLQKSFVADEEMITEFKEFLKSREFEYEDEQFTTELEAISLRLRAQIARIKWDQAEESRIIARADAQIQRALELFDEAEKLSGGSRELAPLDSRRGSDLRADLEKP
jgi:carboxyl-terminal processing protease